MSKLKLYAADFDKGEKIPKRKSKSKKEKMETIVEHEEEKDQNECEKTLDDLENIVHPETKVDDETPSPSNPDSAETKQVGREEIKEKKPADDDPPAWFQKFMERTESLSQAKAPVPVHPVEPEPKPKRKRTTPKRIEPKPKVRRKKPVEVYEVEEDRPVQYHRDQQRAQIDHQFDQMNSLYNKIFGRR